MIDRPELYIFDWDGTLIDSSAKIIAAMQKAADKLSMPDKTDEQIRQIIGLGLPEVMDVLFPEAADACKLALQIGYQNEYRLLDSAARCQLFDGVEVTLTALQERGARLAVATGKARVGLDRMLAAHGLAHFFAATRCADETLSKPDPLMLHELLAELAVEPARALMVGDTDFDLLMANNAGVSAVAVDYGAHPRHRLSACRPERIISSIDQLLEE
jgi:phosphoglycolate phosphatase